MKSGVFLYFLPRNSLGQNLGQPSDPSRDPNADRFGKHQPDKLACPADFSSLFLLFGSIFSVHCLGSAILCCTRQNISHGICRFFLCRGGDVGVGMIECIQVHKGGKLTIIFGGGYEIEEHIEDPSSITA